MRILVLVLPLLALQFLNKTTKSHSLEKAEVETKRESSLISTEQQVVCQETGFFLIVIHSKALKEE